MFKTVIRFLTPFIISLSDGISGVILYLTKIGVCDYNPKIYTLFTHVSGSSILLVLYILATSVHMCKYYKSSCCMILLMHILSILYLYIELSFMWYIYIVWFLSLSSLIFWTAPLLGHKTYKTIHQSCKH